MPKSSSAVKQISTTARSFSKTRRRPPLHNPLVTYGTYIVLHHRLYRALVFLKQYKNIKKGVRREKKSNNNKARKEVKEEGRVVLGFVPWTLVFSVPSYRVSVT
ncbi:hypothetical protein Dimus_028631 [Dionaea muscipula]